MPDSFLPSDVADIFPDSLFDKQNGFKYLFHPFYVHIRGDNEFNAHRHFKGFNI